jgi:ParB family chromosome partitioning protein
MARHSSVSPDWRTPILYVEAARAVMGAIDLDPMSDADANRIVQAHRYFTRDEDGFRHAWSGRVFLNPAGDRGVVKAAWRKLTTEPAVEQFVWIGYSLEQLQTLQQAGSRTTPLDYHVCVPRKRIAFVPKVPTGEDRPSHANYVCYHGPHADRFRELFTVFGQVVQNGHVDR